MLARSQKAARAGTLRVGPCFLRVVWSADGLFDFSVEHSFTEFLSRFSPCRSAWFADIDFVVIDAGNRESQFAKALASISTMTVTVIEAEQNSLVRLNSIEVQDNEYFLVNKILASSKIMNDVFMLMKKSKVGNCILNSAIELDESVIDANMHQEPFSRFLPISASTNALERVLFDIILICKNVGAEE